MKEIDLLEYEAPTIAEFISWNWLQDIVAKYIIWKVDRKWKRYQQRLKRKEWLKNFK